MRPLKLTMSAFGSYAMEQEILFDSRQPLFLITGDTGAGKTTIFDAVCFALYGEMSGKDREGRMMRSDLALPDQKTYVEFIFEDKGILYKIIRNPEYFRRSKKKKKMEDGSMEYVFVKETAKAELYLLEGNFSDFFENLKNKKEIREKSVPQKTIREVNARIVEILGLDQEQFTQISMIAQGEFRKLLISSADQKKEIFQKLFHTEKYRDIVTLLGERKQTLDQALKDKKREQEILLQGISCTDLKYGEELEQYKKLYFSKTQEFFDFLRKYRIAEESWLEEIKKKLKQKREERDHLLLEFHQRQEVNRLFLELEQAEKEKEIWEKSEKTIGEKERRLENAEKAELVMEKRKACLEAEEKEAAKKQETEQKKKEEEKEKEAYNQNEILYQKAVEEKARKEEPLKKEILEMENGLPEYEEIEKIEKEKKQKETKRNQKNREIKTLEDKEKELSESLSDLEKELKEAEEALQGLPEKERKLLNLNEKLSICGELLILAEEIKKFFAKKEESKKKFKKQEVKFREKSADYEEMVIRFTNGQAGLMAEKMRREGTPCPVCGNIHYVKLAELAEEVPAQDEVEKAKEQREKAEEKMKTLAETASGFQNTYHRKLAVCEEKCRQVMPENFIFAENGENAGEIKNVSDIFEKEKETLKTEITELEKIKEEKEQKEENLEEIKKELEQKKEQKEQKKELLGEMEKELSRLQAEIEFRQKSLVYENKKQAEEVLLKKQNELEKICSEYQNYQEEKDQLEKILLRLGAEKKAAENQQKVLEEEWKKKPFGAGIFDGGRTAFGKNRGKREKTVKAGNRADKNGGNFRKAGGQLFKKTTGWKRKKRGR